MENFIIKIEELFDIFFNRKIIYLAKLAIQNNASIKQFLEERFLTISDSIPFNYYDFQIKDDGTTEIVALSSDSDFNSPISPTSEEIQQTKEEEILKEIENLNDQIREKKEALEKFKDEQEEARKENSPPGDIKKEIWGLNILCFSLSIIDSLLIFYFLGPLLGIDTNRINREFFKKPIETIVIICLSIAMFFILTKIISIISETKNKIYKTLWFLIYFSACCVLGYIRTLQIIQGDYDFLYFPYFLLFLFTTSMFPFIVYSFYQKKEKLRKKVILIEGEREKIYKSEIKNLERQREDLLHRTQASFQKLKKKETQETQREYATLRQLQKKLLVYKRIYLYIAKKSGEK